MSGVQYCLKGTSVLWPGQSSASSLRAKRKLGKCVLLLQREMSDAASSRAVMSQTSHVYETEVCNRTRTLYSMNRAWARGSLNNTVFCRSCQRCCRHSCWQRNYHDREIIVKHCIMQWQDIVPSWQIQALLACQHSCDTTLVGEHGFSLLCVRLYYMNSYSNPYSLIITLWFTSHLHSLRPWLLSWARIVMVFDFHMHCMIC